MQTEDINIVLIQEKADKLNQLITKDYPEFSANETYLNLLQETDEWLVELINQLVLARNEVAYELVKLSQRKKADKYYGENT